MRIWKEARNGHRAAVDVLTPQLASPLNLEVDPQSASVDAVAPRLMPTTGGPAALLVPAGLGTSVMRNGVALSPGVHVLRHADRIEFAGRVYWVADVQQAVAVPYDPAVHRDDQHCFITKRRLVPGEMIVTCPGRPGVNCEAIYQQAAWEMAQRSNARFRCPRCRYEPGAAEWRPAVAASSGLTHLLALAGRHLEGSRP